MANTSDVNMQEGGQQDNPLFCGHCFEDCLPGFGHWQKYGNIWEGKYKWVYLCSACSKGFWRLYSKCEEFHDYHRMNIEYMDWLDNELKKGKSN
jgi:hypothetical protein